MNNEHKYTKTDYEQLMHYFSDKHDINLIVEKDNLDYKQCAKTWNILEEMKNIEKFNTDNAWNKLYGRFEEDELVNLNEIKVISLKRIIAVAASIVILLGFVFISKQYVFNNSLVVCNHSKEIKTVILPDGSVVKLNAMAAITYPKKFTKNTREVSFKGEAFFNIERNPEKPFLINVNTAQIKVLGTSFNVFEKNNNAVEVTVKTGKVQLCDCENAGKNITLIEGEKGSLNDKGLVKVLNDNENFIAWMNKKLVFKSTPLKTVVRDINAAYHSNVSLGDKDISSMIITTTFDSLSIDEVLESISLTLNLKVQQQEENTILVKH